MPLPTRHPPASTPATHAPAPIPSWATRLLRAVRLPARRPATNPTPAHTHPVRTNPTRLWPLCAASACAGTLAACVVWAPATWLATVVATATNGQVRLLDATGTVWQGSAALALTPGTGPQAPMLALPSRLHWSLHWHPLPTWQSSPAGQNGQSAQNQPQWHTVQIHLSAPCCTNTPVQLHLRPIPNQQMRWQLQIQPLDMRLPLALLQGLGAPWNTLGIRGGLHLSGGPLTLTQPNRGHSPQNPPHITGTAQAVLSGVASLLSTLPDLGTYRFVWASGPTGEDGTLTLSTLHGALTLNGQGQWANGRMRFEGQASSAAQHGEELSNLLTLIGQRQDHTSTIRWGQSQ